MITQVGDTKVAKRQTALDDDLNVAKQRNTAGETISTQEDARLEERRKTYQELTDIIQRYKTVSERIASGKALDGDIQEAERLEQKISELQKKSILSAYQIEQSERLLVNLYDRLSDLEKKLSESNKDPKSIKDVSTVAEAYNGLISTEEKYQRLQAKDDAGKISESEKTALNILIAQREKYIDKLQESTVLTEKELQLQRKYQKSVESGSVIYNATYSGIRTTDIDIAQEEALKINDILNVTQKLKDEIFAKKQNISGFKDAADRVEKEIDEINEKLISGKISDIQTEYVDKINKILHGFDNVIAVTSPFDEDSARDAMKKYAQSLSSGDVQIKDTINQNGKLTASFEDQKGVLTEIGITWDKVTGKIERSGGVTKKTKTAWGSFLDGLKQRFISLGQYLLSFVGFYEVWAQIKNGITVIKELDTALTEMRKVSDETVKSLRNFQDVSFDIAKSVGSTAQQIQNSTADFMKIGYDLKTASELARDANIYANVGDMEIDEATEHMISSIKAWESEFRNEVEASEAIINRYNEIGNNFAISSADIGSAMERSAAALKAGGNTLDESLGLIVAGNVIQQDAETTAAALKILSLRIRGSKAELEEMGESTDDLASSTSKLREEIKALTGVDIMKDENTYKSTAEIIKEIGKNWGKLSDISQAATLEKLAGKNRASTVAGLLENYDIIDEVIKSAENSDNSAIEENERYLDSIEGKIALFQNEVQEFWHKLLDSDFIKDVIDFGTWLMDFLGNLIEELGTVGVTITALTAGKAVKGLFVKEKSGGRAKEFALITNMPPNRLAERCAR